LQNAKDASAATKLHSGVASGRQAAQAVFDQSVPVGRIILKWARGFNVETEEWILSGALQTISRWHRFPDSPRQLDLTNFRQIVAETNPIREGGRHFRFHADGWDPTLMSFAGWREGVTNKFKQVILKYERTMGGKAKQRGLEPTVQRFSPEHFDWLALFHCGNQSLEAIRTRGGKIVAADKTAISRGIHLAAKLARINVRSTRPKLKKH
jgi:hypothetical protein